MSSQVEVLEAERRLYKLEQELGEDPTEQQLAACRPRARRLRGAGRLHHRGQGAQRHVRPRICGGRPAPPDHGVLRRLADAHRAGEAPHPQPRGAAARRTHEPPGPGEREMAGRVPPRLRGHRGGGEPRPRVHGQHGGPRGRGGQRPGEPVQGQLLGLPAHPRGAPRAPARRGGEAGRGDRPHGGVRREVPLQAHEGQAGAGPRQEAREDQAHRASRGEEDRALQLQAAAAHRRRGGARPRPW